MATAELREVDGRSDTGKLVGGQLRCVVVTPERTLFDEVVDFVALPLFDGEIGLLPGRTPLIGRLGYGELRTRTGEVTKRYFVDGGFCQVRDNVVTVLTNRATPAAQVDAADAGQELETAKALKPKGDLDQSAKDKAVERARARVRIASRRG